jgi:hypothetical protein
VFLFLSSCDVLNTRDWFLEGCEHDFWWVMESGVATQGYSMVCSIPFCSYRLGDLVLHVIDYLQLSPIDSLQVTTSAAPAALV